MNPFVIYDKGTIVMLSGVGIPSVPVLEDVEDKPDPYYEKKK